MFLCRRRLLLLQVSRILQTSHTATALFSTECQSESDPAGASDASKIISNALDKRRKFSCYTDPIAGATVQELLDAITGHHKRPFHGKSRLIDAHASPRADPERVDRTVDMYLSLRRRDRQLLRNLPPSAFIRVARKASAGKLFAVLDSIATDVVEVFQSSDDERSAVIRVLLQSACKSPSPQYSRIFSLFESLPHIDASTSLPAKVLVCVTKAILSQSSSIITEYIPFFESIIPRLVNDPDSDRGTPEARSMYENDLPDVGDPPSSDHIWLTFRLLHLVLERGEERRALNIFQALFHGGKIPVDIVQESDQATGDFRSVLVSALVRACIQYGWWNGAAQILSTTTGTNEEPFRSHFSGLATEVMDAFYVSGTARDAENCCRMVLAVISEDSGFSLPDEQILQFYDLAREVRHGDLAERVYCRLRSEAIWRKRQYPHPKGPALTYLMYHFTNRSINLHAARLLAQHVVQSEKPLSVLVRAPFIGMCAEKGFNREARALWERYSVGRDKDMVVGHAGMMLRMISLLTLGSRRRKTRTKTKPPGAGIEDNAAEPGTYHDAERNSHRIESTDLTEGLPATPSSQLIEATDGEAFNGSGLQTNLPDTYHSSDNDEAGDTDLLAPTHESSDMSFARRVLVKYQQSKEPLLTASHMDINALARAHSMMGNLTECLNALRVILSRFEIPDLYDINVALAAMAKHHPQRAARMIEKMLAKGLEPNGVTFATVINEALADGDTELVGRLMLKARALGLGELTDSAVASLLRANLTAVRTGRLAPGEKARGYLERAYEVIMSTPWSANIHTPNIGKQGIAASLRADEPELAFKFWRLLVKEQTEWGYGVQVELRRGIADAVRRHCFAGRMEGHRGQRMIMELETETGNKK